MLYCGTCPLPISAITSVGGAVGNVRAGRDGMDNDDVGRNGGVGGASEGASMQ
jgi:hypothetical protein